MQINYMSVPYSLPREDRRNRISRRLSLLINVLTLVIVPHFARAAIDWPTYGFNLQRTGENRFESILTPSTVGGLHLLWSFDLGAVTIMQTVLAACVFVYGLQTDIVYFGYV